MSSGLPGRRLVAAWTRIPLGRRLAVALVVGAGAGLALGPSAEALRPLGELLVFLLRALAIPVVVSAVLGGLSGTSPRVLGGDGGRLLVVYALSTLLAAALGAACGRLAGMGPQARAQPGPGAPVPSLLPPDAAPARPEAHSVERAVPFALAGALVLALGVASWRERRPGGAAQAVHRGFVRLEALVARALQAVLEYAPIGTFALAALGVGVLGGRLLQPLAAALAAVYGAQLLLALALLASLAAAGHSVLAFVGRVREPLLAALVTGSSAASLPLELAAARSGLRIPGPRAAFGLSLGIAISKTGTAAFIAALAGVALAASGRAVAPAEWLGLVLLSSLAAATTPPVSGGGFVMLGLVLHELRLDPGLALLLLGLPFVGKGNTPLNCLGRLVGVTLALMPVASRVPFEPGQADGASA